MIVQHSIAEHGIGLGKEIQGISTISYAKDDHCGAHKREEDKDWK
jgi:hypothetical protein